MKWIPCASMMLILAATASASDLRSRLEQYVGDHEPQIYAELVELLSIPNVAADRANIRRNAEFLRRMLERRGLAAEILETEENPLVFGQALIPGAARTLLLYMHYDGQPVDPQRWQQEHPFRPLLRSGKLGEGVREIRDTSGIRRFEPEWRLYARSSSDDKSPIVAFCAALDALRAVGREPTSNIKVILDGEEEAGSASLTGAIDRYREKLRADAMLILDGPLHPSGRPTLTFGARGIATLELTVYGPKVGLHSGHYGNWVPNPALRLAQLLASMKDDRGRVAIPGFYDLIPAPGPEELRILASVPDDLEGLRRLFGFAEPDGVGNTLQEALQYPSLNIRGLHSAYVGGEARTIVPSEATAAVDIRLVRETPSYVIVPRVLEHIRGQGYHIVDREPDDDVRLRHPKIVRVVQRDATEAYRTAMDLPVSLQAAAALRGMWGEDPVRIRTSGGTVPISRFIRALGLPAIGLPTVNFDNNQHGENENLRLGHLWRGIVSIAALLLMD